MGFAVEALEFEHACLTNSRERRKDCKGKLHCQFKTTSAGKTCDCVVAHASRFAFDLVINWEPVLPWRGAPRTWHAAFWTFCINMVL